jgi:hypothetical protein
LNNEVARATSEDAFVRGVFVARQDEKRGGVLAELSVVVSRNLNLSGAAHP